jgi:hypothetical protein
MNTQPEALRLADALEELSLGTRSTMDNSAKELRRLYAENEAIRNINENLLKLVTNRMSKLHEVNQELVEALKWALDQIEDDLDPDHQTALDQARATLAEATGEKNGCA